jgi:hypothetical protein
VRRIIGGQHPGLGAVACSIAPSRQDKQITMSRVTLGGLACGLALLLLPACSSGLSDNGPFGNGGPNEGTICTWTKPGGVAHDSFDEFPNTGGTATIAKVALVHPRHLRLIAAWAVPTNGELGNAGPGYPPGPDNGPGFRWGQRQRIPGAVVRHTRGQDVINLVIVMKPTAKFGTATAVNLYYESAGTRYLLHFPFGYKIVDGHPCH